MFKVSEKKGLSFSELNPFLFANNSPNKRLNIGKTLQIRYTRYSELVRQSLVY
ncbi:hypothetical protein HMPREF0027_0978 [Actinobacillus ureae ATCC 25976]|uniref:Uncharacterized protein n=1 Tax=Actinobacillus ureae ATCC 25976 TaxID=887324 RepID=E8KGL1_9PAST|nr:hypothetical protein HMPREF0027_0978 [Actinobacillus ureae ATCC 25976]